MQENAATLGNWLTLSFLLYFFSLQDSVFSQQSISHRVNKKLLQKGCFLFFLHLLKRQEKKRNPSIVPKTGFLSNSVVDEKTTFILILTLLAWQKASALMTWKTRPLATLSSIPPGLCSNSSSKKNKALTHK
jgi:hypothetical protein